MTSDAEKREMQQLIAETQLLAAEARELLSVLGEAIEDRTLLAATRERIEPLLASAEDQIRISRAMIDELELTVGNILH